jgi:hypothetical protein
MLKVDDYVLRAGVEDGDIVLVVDGYELQARVEDGGDVLAVDDCVLWAGFEDEGEHRGHGRSSILDHDSRAQRQRPMELLGESARGLKVYGTGTQSEVRIYNMHLPLPQIGEARNKGTSRISLKRETCS